MELEAEVNLLLKQKTFLEKQAYVADKKAIIYDMMINMAEKEYHIGIRKTYYPNNRQLSQQGKRKFNRQLWIVRVEQTCLLQEYKKELKPTRIRLPKLIELVENLCLKMPKLGGKKLYFILWEELKYLRIGGDRSDAVLQAKPATPGSYHLHRFFSFL